MNDKFNVIFPAASANATSEATQDAMYLSCEDFLIQYIAQAIEKAAKAGRKHCRIQLGYTCFPDGLTANKVLEHVASPLWQLGYSCKLVNCSCFDVKWGEDVMDCEPF